MTVEKPNPEYRNFTIRVTDNRARDYFIQILMSYLHLRNMLLILIKRNREEHLAQPEHRPDLFRYLSSNRIMRALLWQQKGGGLAEKVQFLQQHYAHDQMMQESIELSFGLKDKIISELVKQLQESWKSFFAKIKAGDRTAREPKARKLKDCPAYSLPIGKLLRKRSHFLDSNFKKLAIRLLMTLEAFAVTHLVTSRNIIAKKSLGVEMGSIQNQRFYFLPLGKLVDMLKLFGPRFGITVIDSIDEAYTSKTSCLSGDVVKAHELFKDQNIQDGTLRSDVFQGRRVKRGLYKDLPSGKVIHADINAAANILKLHLKDPSLFATMADTLFKLANPRVLRKNALLCLLDRPCGFPCVVGEQVPRTNTLPNYPLNPGHDQV